MSPTSALGPVRLLVRGVIAEVTLRVGVGNRLDATSMVGLCDAAAAISLDERVRVVVLSGLGRSFCEGLAAESGTDDGVADGVAAIAELRVPTIALLHGRTAGIGLALALACDVRCAARDARFSVTDPARGAFPGGGLLARLPRVVGPARATEMTLLGRAVDVRTSLAWGLIAASAPRAGLRVMGRRLADTMAAAAPLGMRYAKEAVVRALDLPLDDGIRLEQDLYVLLQTTADRREGVAAFRARRMPHFHGS